MQGGVKIDHHLPVHPLPSLFSLIHILLTKHHSAKNRSCKSLGMAKNKAGSPHLPPCASHQRSDFHRSLLGLPRHRRGLHRARWGRATPTSKAVFRSQPEPIEPHLRTPSMATMVAAPPAPDWESWALHVGQGSRRQERSGNAWSAPCYLLLVEETWPTV